MINVQMFVTRYPELEPLVSQQPGYLELVIEDFEEQVSANTEGRDALIMLLCADSIAKSPRGRAAQLVAKNGTSTYSNELDSRLKTLALGNRFF